MLIYNVIKRLEDPALEWTTPSLAAALHQLADTLQVKSKHVMLVARRQLTGMKVRKPYRLLSFAFANCCTGHSSQTGPGVPEIMDVLGKDRTLARFVSHGRGVM